MLFCRSVTTTSSTSARSSAMRLAIKSCVIGRGGTTPCSASAIACASAAPTQIGSTLPDAGSRKTTIGVPVRPSRPIVDSSTGTGSPRSCAPATAVSARSRETETRKRETGTRKKEQRRAAATRRWHRSRYEAPTFITKQIIVATKAEPPKGGEGTGRGVGLATYSLMNDFAVHDLVERFEVGNVEPSHRLD